VILFDLSRLVSRAGRETPTGIDRVELAYAEHLTRRGLPLLFTALTAAGRFGLLPRARADDYIGAIGQLWRGATGAHRDLRRTRQLARMLNLRAALQGESVLVKRIRAEIDPPAYLLVSHHHLEKRRAIARLKRQARASFVCLIHDLIPIEFPEYALPGQDDKHRRRIESAAALADAVIVNSAVTRDAFLPYLERAGRNPPVLVAPFGVDLPSPARA
jgi:glycosyltransferase involved in cell wall biosynthesis